MTEKINPQPTEIPSATGIHKKQNIEEPARVAEQMADKPIDSDKPVDKFHLSMMLFVTPPKSESPSIRICRLRLNNPNLSPMLHLGMSAIVERPTPSSPIPEPRALACLAARFFISYFKFSEVR